MSAFGATPTAEVIEGTGDFDLMMLARMGEHELVQQITFVCQRYSEIVEKNKQDRIADLEQRFDDAVIRARNLLENAAKLKHATFTAMQQQASAESNMRNADNALARLHHSINHDRSLKTRREVAEQAKQVEAAKQAAHNAQYAYSLSTTAVRNAVMMENAANAEAGNAQAEARGLKSQIDVMQGKQRIQGNNGFYIS
ncbi:hypothetical protein [Edaphobacter sp. 12200R-103]|uniref:hypothetical protein n=1 Tax=Edaphobacter sp. 12200R-103 TaxID=2703788 RepID=UPI00138D1E2D|nr:hypothetical protein [Edaphobacter sp. 12200R-103]QHS51722.1 hypothetical protein GWR55_08195 [Edaphobacter sp. 12200R-103]